MYKILCCVAAIAMLPVLSIAETTEDEKFNWVWEGQLDVSGLKINQSGSLCISKEMTRRDLSEAFRQYDETCEVLGWNMKGDVTHFALACDGAQSTDLAGELTVVKDAAELKLMGDVRLGDTNVLPTTGLISADWTGVCEAPEVTEIAEAAETAPVAAVPIVEPKPIAEET